MSEEDYSRAQKLGKKEYQSRMMRGLQPTLEGFRRYFAAKRFLLRSSAGTCSDPLRPDCRYQNRWQK